MIREILLPARFEEQIEREALAAAPRECCGLIEGVRDGEQARVATLHPMRNLAAGADRFELAPSEQIALARRARERGHAIIGCYHSHPGGGPEPSAADKAGAGEEDFIWLIAAVSGERVKIAAFVHEAGEFSPVSLSA